MSSLDIRMSSDATRWVQMLKRRNMGEIWSESKMKAYGCLFLGGRGVVNPRGEQSGMHSAISNCLFHEESSVLGFTSSWQTYHHPADSQHCEGISNPTWMVPFENNACHQPNYLAWTNQSRINWPLCNGKCFVTQSSHRLLFPQHSGWHC